MSSEHEFDPDSAALKARLIITGGLGGLSIILLAAILSSSRETSWTCYAAAVLASSAAINGIAFLIEETRLTGQRRLMEDLTDTEVLWDEALSRLATCGISTFTVGAALAVTPFGTPILLAVPLTAIAALYAWRGEGRPPGEPPSTGTNGASRVPTSIQPDQSDHQEGTEQS